MPYEARGTQILSKKTGKVVGRSKTPDLAKKAARVRNAIMYSTEGKKRGPRRSV